MRNLANKLRSDIKNHKKTVLALGLVGLVTTAAMKDNVHLGSTTIYNPQGTQYFIGVAPTIKVESEKKRIDTNIRAFGLLSTKVMVENNSYMVGDISSYGLAAGVNDIGQNSKIIGDVSSYGLVAGANYIGQNSKIFGDVSSYGLVAGANDIGQNSKIIGNVSSSGLVANLAKIGANTHITGNIYSKGFYSQVMGNGYFLSKSIIGMDNYHVKSVNADDKNVSE